MTAASSATTPRPTSASDVQHERVLVRTQYVGQGLRVTLLRTVTRQLHALCTETRDVVQAELYIASGHRLVVEDGGIRVQRLEST